jgi:hypothetical protein
LLEQVGILCADGQQHVNGSIGHIIAQIPSGNRGCEVSQTQVL